MKRKLMVISMSIVVSACLLVGCGSTANTPNAPNASNTEKQETDEVDKTNTLEQTEVSDNLETEVTSDVEAVPLSFADISNLEFWFGSGAGAWCTVLTIHEDGTFEGQYHDSDMGDVEKEYPNGVVYLCNFAGEFTQPEKVDEYTYSMEIKSIVLAQDAETEEIKDGVRYLYSEPYGLEDAENILIYLPGASLQELPEAYKSWVGYSEFAEGTETELPFYGLFNVKAECGFSSYEIAMGYYGIDDELTSVEEEVAILENRLQTENLTQTEMNDISSQIYQLWDDELNAVWNQLKETLDATAMDKLTTEERDWITDKEAEIKRAGAEYEGGSMQLMIENNKGAELTKARVYELAKML